jgi:hypothetical protein
LAHKNKGYVENPGRPGYLSMTQMHMKNSEQETLKRREYMQHMQHARAVANDCYRFILEMSTNAGIVSDALKYVTQKTEQIDTYNGRS